MLTAREKMFSFMLRVHNIASEEKLRSMAEPRPYGIFYMEAVVLKNKDCTCLGAHRYTVSIKISFLVTTIPWILPSKKRALATIEFVV